MVNGEFFGIQLNPYKYTLTKDTILSLFAFQLPHITFTTYLISLEIWCRKVVVFGEK
jgi:hypothetical protein